jgi:hypothetical protein
MVFSVIVTRNVELGDHTFLLWEKPQNTQVLQERKSPKINGSRQASAVRLFINSTTS